MNTTLVAGSEIINIETPIHWLAGELLTPTERFYVRNHFPIPVLDPSTWRLRVGGLVMRPLQLSLPDLLAMPSRTEVVTLECAGNGRAFLNPRVEGEQWGLGAVSTAEWTGVPLVEVLDRARSASLPTYSLPSRGEGPGGAVHILFRGADAGSVNSQGPTAFERSLTLEEIKESGAILAYAMNGEPLPLRHGYPLRLIVAGWYGVASVKWLTEIEVINRPFCGYFQTKKYVYERERNGQVITEPVSLQRVRALITEPRPDQEVEPGPVAIRGLAWSGMSPIARVELSVGQGPWQQARLLGEATRHSWVSWELIAQLDRPGPTTVRARATDLAGRTQPDQPDWNRLGYGSNGIRATAIRVRPIEGPTRPGRTSTSVSFRAGV